MNLIDIIILHFFKQIRNIFIIFRFYTINKWQPVFFKYIFENFDVLIINIKY